VIDTYREILASHYTFIDSHASSPIFSRGSWTPLRNIDYVLYLYRTTAPLFWILSTLSTKYSAIRQHYYRHVKLTCLIIQLRFMRDIDIYRHISAQFAAAVCWRVSRDHKEHETITFIETDNWNGKFNLRVPRFRTIIASILNAFSQFFLCRPCTFFSLSSKKTRTGLGKMTREERAIGVTGNSGSARRKVLCCWGNAAKGTRAALVRESEVDFPLPSHPSFYSSSVHLYVLPQLLSKTTNDWIRREHWLR